MDSYTWTLLDTIQEAVQSILLEAKIYDVQHLGWLNENDPDPKEIGHAMWQVDQPSLRLHELAGDEPVNRRPDELDKVVATVGEDFYGLMQLSRLSIGLAMLWQFKSRKEPYSENPHFWLHYTDAFVKLAMASDRLRDLLIIACSGDLPKKYKKRGQFYVTPFETAEGVLAAGGYPVFRYSASIHLLPSIGKSLWTYVERRNQIVHHVATEPGKRTSQNFTELQARYDREQQSGFTPLTLVDSMSGLAQTQEVSGGDEEINAASDEVQAWYKLLVEASNHIFQIEYWNRLFRRIHRNNRAARS